MPPPMSLGRSPYGAGNAGRRNGSFSDLGIAKMTQTRTARRATPVAQMMMGSRQLPRATKQEENSRATLDDFDREHMGIAAKE